MTIKVAPCQEIWRIESMEDIRAIFPAPDDVNSMNLIIFSTSGIHGSYSTIEDVEKSILDEDPSNLTVQIIQPRCVTFGFGSIPVELSDIPYLKELRKMSWNVMSKIGAHEESLGEKESE